jgi:hypothetical protein
MAKIMASASLRAWRYGESALLKPMAAVMAASEICSGGIEISLQQNGGRIESGTKSSS